MPQSYELFVIKSNIISEIKLTKQHFVLFFNVIRNVSKNKQ